MLSGLTPDLEMKGGKYFLAWVILEIGNQIGSWLPKSSYQFIMYVKNGR